MRIRWLFTFTLLGVMLGLALLLGRTRAAAADNITSAPPIPPIEQINDLGAVVQNPVIYGRDGTFSALINGKSVWTFGDTPLAVPGQSGDHWVDNSLSWTTDLDASDGITLDHDLLDRTGAPAEFLPYTREERLYNYVHDADHCRLPPCGAEYALWPGHLLADPDRNRVLVFYGLIHRVAGQSEWTYIGSGIAVKEGNGPLTRPTLSPGSEFPTLLWTDAAGESGLDGGYVVEGSMLYTYGCSAGFLIMNCIVGRVPLADALDRTQWRYYAGNDTWSTTQADAAIIFNGGAAGNAVFYVPYLNMYMTIYSGVFSDNLYYRVSWTPWGPWSEETFLFTARPGWEGSVSYAGQAHVEYAAQDGRVQYVTYVRTTGFLQFDIPLVQVTFGDPQP